MSTITNMKRGKKKHFGKKRRGLPLKYWRDYLILGSGSPVRLPGPSGDRRALIVNDSIWMKTCYDIVMEYDLE